jgi:hypothetical protein
MNGDTRVLKSEAIVLAAFGVVEDKGLILVLLLRGLGFLAHRMLFRWMLMGERQAGYVITLSYTCSSIQDICEFVLLLLLFFVLGTLPLLLGVNIGQKDS